MRIVVEPSEYYLDYNVGDIAMTHVAVARLSHLWPEASIQVLTEPSSLFSRYCPRATPIFERGYQPRADGSGARPQLLSRLLARAKSRILSDRSEQPLVVKQAIANSDLMVVCGMGGVTDAFCEFAFGLLGKIELALSADIPVVMMGQGIGPLRERRLRAKASAILSRVALIALRESRFSHSLLIELGVSPSRIITTGDDAIEIACPSRLASWGDALGVNLRAASYSGVDKELLESVRSIVRAAAASLNAPVVALPTAEEDVETIGRLVSGCVLAGSLERSADPLEMIERIKLCRVVLTGSYHAAVFALSMGIPSVCIAASDYYSDKFLGLADQFGAGCEVVLVDRDDWQAEAALKVEQSWRSAESLRPQLLAAAERQMKFGVDAYRRIRDDVVASVRH
ncbi:MAG: polysaccharide pyruvyl transferase family protein [Candidatus Binatus sp.]|uniref:polysaccharide pyruvyl transferase family protein n=1 Tax=Candidatus Binatus sp. TaxID=2811406 RepID=UPI002723F4D4|nr:polysaccharide pyruvyl transferase family protein [Candidatus Binatus sp.]MDO8431269.1 polysaccharide pyruvyl transferase family protein [Candidatus Binatus sp.]